MNPVSFSTSLPGLVNSNLVMPKGLTPSDAAGKANFGNAIEQALNNVSAAQGEASTLSREFQMENPNVSLEETMIALQKASLGFQSAVQVRNKLVTAYNDIMNMPV